MSEQNKVLIQRAAEDVRKVLDEIVVPSVEATALSVALHYLEKVANA